jgi:hypothetical protein
MIHLSRLALFSVAVIVTGFWPPPDALSVVTVRDAVTELDCFDG